MVFDIEGKYGIKAFELRSKIIPPDQHHVEFAYFTGEPTHYDLSNIDNHSSISMETYHAKVQTIIYQDRKYRFVLDKDLQELLDILVHLKSDEEILRIETIYRNKLSLTEKELEDLKRKMNMTLWDKIKSYFKKG